jgi:hypothetical protein
MSFLKHRFNSKPCLQLCRTLMIAAPRRDYANNARYSASKLKIEAKPRNFSGHAGGAGAGLLWSPTCPAKDGGATALLLLRLALLLRRMLLLLLWHLFVASLRSLVLGRCRRSHAHYHDYRAASARPVY